MKSQIISFIIAFGMISLSAAAPAPGLTQAEAEAYGNSGRWTVVCTWPWESEARKCWQNCQKRDAKLTQAEAEAYGNSGRWTVVCIWS